MQKKNFPLQDLFYVLILCFYVTNVWAQDDNDYLITPVSFGKINKAATYDSLVKIYGPNNLANDFYVAESDSDDSSQITIVYPETERQFTVYWVDGMFGKKISFVEIFQRNAPYYTVDGLRIGDKLKKVLQVNKKRIDFLGFGWDYGGAIVSLNKGILENSPIRFWLDVESTTNSHLDGDKQFNTSMSIVKNNMEKIIIAKIQLSFYENDLKN